MAITITFGDNAENHKGMEKIGADNDSEGFTIAELKAAKKLFEEKGYTCKHIDLSKSGDVEASVLIIQNGVNCLLSDKNKTADDLLKEQNKLSVDKKAFMYGRVVDKKARHNLCFADYSQKADFENGKGTIVSFDDIKLTKKIRKELPKYFGAKAEKLVAEGNYYYDIENCGIGFHGDAERNKVIAIRLGDSIPLHFQWFKDSKPVGKRIKLKLEHGDMYAMSAKAVGTDWMKKSIMTLRHAAGAKKFLTIKNLK